MSIKCQHKVYAGTHLAKKEMVTSEDCSVCLFFSVVVYLFMYCVVGLFLT